MLASLNHPNIAAIHGLEEVGRVEVPGARVRRRNDARRASRGRAALDRRRSLRLRPDRPGARGRARGRRDSPRLEARQRHGPPGRLRQGARLRARPAGQRGQRRFAGPFPLADTDCRNGGRRHPGHRGLHEPRAGARQAARQAHRHLLLRLRALRVSDRQAGLSRRDRLRHARRRPQDGAGSGRAAAGDAAQGPGPLAALPREGPCPSPPRHRRRADRDRRCAGATGAPAGGDGLSLSPEPSSLGRDGSGRGRARRFPRGARPGAFATRRGSSGSGPLGPDPAVRHDAAQRAVPVLDGLLARRKAVGSGRPRRQGSSLRARSGPAGYRVHPRDGVRQPARSSRRTGNGWLSSRAAS